MNNNYRNEEPQYKTLEEALKLVMQAVQGEKEDEIFYDYLISVAPTNEEKDIISSIRDDEMKHFKMFREIYYYFTGVELPMSTRSDFKAPENYIDGIKKAFFGELAAMERYRNIRAGLPSEYYRDMVFEILTDEMKHADKYNYILNLNVENMGQVGMTQTNTSVRSRQNQRDSNQREDQQDRSNGNETEQMVTLDDLKRYIKPLVEEAMREVNEGKELEALFQKYILIGILIGNGFTPNQSMEQVTASDYHILNI